MKKSNPYLSGLLVAGTAMFASCQKDDVLATEKEVIIENASAKSANCVATAFNVRYADGNKMVFKTQFSPSAAQATRINAGVYHGGVITSNLDLDIKRQGRTLTVYKAGSSTESILVITLNNNRKVISAVAGTVADINFLPTEFTYENGSLSSMKMKNGSVETMSRFHYSNGNIIKVEDVDAAGNISGQVQYEYDLGVKAAKQLYLEETRNFNWNTFTLLQYLGYFPELDPSNLRTRTKVLWANNYVVFDAKLQNHRVENGRLVSYEVTFPGSSVTIPHEIQWDCAARNDDELD